MTFHRMTVPAVCGCTIGGGLCGCGTLQARWQMPWRIEVRDPPPTFAPVYNDVTPRNRHERRARRKQAKRRS